MRIRTKVFTTLVEYDGVVVPGIAVRGLGRV
jgi:hypothetical protein